MQRCAAMPQRKRSPDSKEMVLAQAPTLRACFRRCKRYYTGRLSTRHSAAKQKAFAESAHGSPVDRGFLKCPPGKSRTSGSGRKYLNATIPLATARYTYPRGRRMRPAGQKATRFLQASRHLRARLSIIVQVSNLRRYSTQGTVLC